MANQRLYPHWARLTTALRTGQPQGEAGTSGETFSAIYADPAPLKSFLSAMTGVSRGANIAIAAKFPWANYRTVVDIGPAQGDLLTQVMLKNSHLLGIGFDLPEVGAGYLPGIHRNEQVVIAGAVPGRELLYRSHSQRRSGDDGPYPARLES